MKEREFYLAVSEDICSSSNVQEQFEIGDSIILQTKDGEEFRSSISGKVFKTREGDRIEEAVSSRWSLTLFYFLFLSYCLILNYFFSFSFHLLYSMLATA